MPMTIKPTKTEFASFAANYPWEKNVEYISNLLTEAREREDVTQANVENAVLSLLVLAETLASKADLKDSAKAIRTAWYAVDKDPT